MPTDLPFSQSQRASAQPTATAGRPHQPRRRWIFKLLPQPSRHALRWLQCPTLLHFRSSRRHLHRDVPPASAASFSTGGHTPPAQGTPSRGESDHQTRQGVLLLAQDGERHSGGGTCLHGLSVRKDTPARETTARTHSSAMLPFCTPARGFGGPTSQFRRLHTLVYHCG